MNKMEGIIMNRKTTTPLLGKLILIFASLILCIGMSATQVLAAPAATKGNNFTMISAGGSGITGGTNDVDFTWDGTLKTSVAVSGQIPNATISSTCPFFGSTWQAHDVAIYGPGTYTIYTACPAGSPGCGDDSTGHYTFTVGPDELGGHMLFLWSGSDDIDLVDVWSKNAVFGPSPMCIFLSCGSGATCADNPAGKVWELMSKDWDGDGINGATFVDGPFVGFSGNFNLMTKDPCEGLPDGAPCDDLNACTSNDRCVTGKCTGDSKDCSDKPVSNACTDDVCNPATGVCSNPVKNCNDNNVCTDDACDTIMGCVYTYNTSPCDNTSNTDRLANFCSGGVCVPGVCNTNIVSGGTVTSKGNNFTMLAADGGFIGGTNDVVFSWDGSLMTSVAVSGQRSNASLSSTCAFFGYTWSTTDTAVYGPGTYTVYPACPPGSPGCGDASAGAYTFTVKEDQMGVHMLFAWGAPCPTCPCGAANCNIDVVDIWAPKSQFGPSPMWIGACGSNSKTRVWDWMSTDWDKDGINGAQMLDGPFKGSNANFNVMAIQCDNYPSEPNLVYPANGAQNLGTTVEFRWKKSTDLDKDLLTYTLQWCTDKAFSSSCTTSAQITNILAAPSARNSRGIFYAGGAGLLMIGVTFIGGIKGRKKIVLLLIIVALFSGGLIVACKNDNVNQTQSLDISELSYKASGLSSNTTYYWKVTSDDGKGGTVQSPRQDQDAWSFKTQ